MSVARNTTAEADDRRAVLSKATVRAAERLGLNKATLARVIGISPATATRLSSADGAYRLDPKRKEWELALLLVRVYRSLDSIVGTDDSARIWLNSYNRGLNGKPADLIVHTQGLVNVVEYLDGFRGRL